MVTLLQTPQNLRFLSDGIFMLSFDHFTYNYFLTDLLTDLTADLRVSRHRVYFRGTKNQGIR